ncbi:MAG TPA: biopolymer transporter ExbD [Myxococcales bacterium]|jgi:biopolymer transport protein ExbD|nr:biopolymer transporter ExbD [Myxococcales bacterium]
MAFHFSKRRLRPQLDENSGDLNLVPYLDILMNLIIFMLLSMTGLVSYGVLNVSSPKYASGGAASSEGEDPTKPKLLLTVLVSERGFFIAGAGTVLGGEGGEQAGEPPADDQGKPTIPRGADGSYDYATLTAKMLEIKKAFPEESKVILGADPAVPYETLVATMDACREHAGQMLFFDVSLTVM